MPHLLRALFAIFAFAVVSPVQGQVLADACAVPDSIDVRGNTRLRDAIVLADAGIAPGDTLDRPKIERAIRNMYESRYFDDIRVDCLLSGPGRRPVLIIDVKERPLLNRIEIRGADRLSERQVRDRLNLFAGRPADPGEIARSLASVDSLYKSRSYYLARIGVDSTEEAGGLTLSISIEEGRRLAISGIEIEGNEGLSDEEIVGAMRTRPEGLLWFRSGEFDELAFESDLSERIPQLYADHGYVDARVTRDTLIVDPDIGKAMIVITVDEGPQYQLGSFEVVGNRYFTEEELRDFYPFGRDTRSLTQRVLGVLGRQAEPDDVFDLSRWEDATNELRRLYASVGFISVQIEPVVERSMRADSTPVVNLVWDISEGKQAIVNRIDIAGNQYTVESCIRQQLTIFPGSVYDQERVMQSWQKLNAMGFFEEIPPPDIQPVEGDTLGLWDITFNLTEKRTGNLNFGASMGGGGAGVGGFIGFDQPNLFGKCKRGSLNWQFGSLLNEFDLGYTDPSIKGSNYSGSANLYHLNSRYIVTDFGRQTRIGGMVRLGVPLKNALNTRLFFSYGGEAVKYSRDPSSLLGQVNCNNCFRSTIGTNITRDTRIGLPFPHSGGYQTADAQFNGGPLGGTAKFQRYTWEFRSHAPVGQMGGNAQGGQPVRFVLGLTVRAGMVFGSTGPFFPFQEFAMGGVQQGEMLRGYEEFTITPRGFVTSGSAVQADRSSFGRAFMSTSAELGAKVSQSFYTSVFFDAGNVWARPQDFNPTRMFRGAGVGFALVTPLGPLGLDYAYGFDKLDSQGRPKPGWQLHFKLGQFF